MPVQSEYYLSLPGNLHIGITSSQELFLGKEEELLLGAYLPDVKVLDSSPDQIDMALHHVESTDASLTVGKDEIEIRDRWNTTFPDDLPHLLYSIARTLWLERGYFPTHAACVGDAAFTLMPGHSGVGKTTTALNAVTRHDQKLLSGNTTLVKFTEAGNLQAVSGTKTMTLKTEDFERGGYDNVRNMAYGNRTAFELPAYRQMQRPKDVGRIALVRVSNGMNVWSRLSPLSALHTLYPYILDTEHADCVIAQGSAIYLDDTPSALRRQLAMKLGDALADIPVDTGIGSAEFLAGKVSDS